jgi:hypothetical protein
MKDVGLWPQEAKPLPFDVSLVISRLPIHQRTAVYGRLAGLSFEEIARQMGITKGAVAATLTTPCRDLHVAAKCSGVMPTSRPGEFPSTQEELIAEVNRRLQGYRPTLKEGWRYLEPGDRKMFASNFSVAFDADVLVHEGGGIEFHSPQGAPGSLPNAAHQG